jgi:transcription initiation factor TFIIIB Brf1 subunit/transcription initiation factor TFIIB
MSLDDKYLDMSELEIDNLLYGVNLVKKPETSKELCISCFSDKLVIDNNKEYLVCQDCAVINEECVEKNQEFTNDLSTNSRYGCPSNFFYPKSALGTKINSRGPNRMSLLQKQGQMPYKEKSLMEVLERIQGKCKKYNITQTIIDTAKILYKKVSECKHTKGKRKGKNMIMRCVNRRSMIAACVFHASKLQKEPRSPKEIADIYDLEIRHVNRGCRKFLDFIDITTIFFEIKSSQSSDFIERFAKKLNIEKQYIDKAKAASTNIHKLGLATTHEPPSVAAGCILLVGNMYQIEISKKNISEIFGISDVTISKTYRKIFPYHKIILNDQVTELILEKKNNIQKKQVTLTEDDLILTDDASELSSECELSSELNSEFELLSDEEVFTKKNNILFS